MTDIAQFDRENLTRAIAAASPAISRESAVAQLMKLLREAETPEGIALIKGFAQSLRLYDNGEPINRPYWISNYEGTRTEPQTLDVEVLAEAASDPEASDFTRAHIGHLVFSYRTNRTELADKAIEAYMRLSRHPDIEFINQYPFAVKAHELAKLRGEETSMSDAKAILLAIADDVLARAAGEPEGGTFLLTIRQYKRVGGDKEATRDRADLALERFNGDWHLRRELALFRASLEDDAELGNAIVRAELERLIAEADTREGLLKENLLREALSTARAQGLRDIAGLASSKLAGLTPEDYELKAHEMGVRLAPNEAKQVRDTIQAIQEAAPSEAWATWANITPEFLPREERESYEFRIVDRIATLNEINRRGHVSFVAETDDQIIEYRNHQHDRQHYEVLYSLLIGPGLEILLSRDDCKELLYRNLGKNPLLTDVGRGRLRAAFDVSASTDDFAVVGDSLPTLESMVRQLAISAQVSIYNASGSANVFRTLGGLISDLTKLLEPGARLGRFWAFALTDQLGYNIRNDYLHGFSETLTRFEATIILQIYAQMMFLINYSIAAERAESNAAQSPRNSDAVPG